MENLGDILMRALPEKTLTSNPLFTGKVFGRSQGCSLCGEPYILKRNLRFACWVPACRCAAEEDERRIIAEREERRKKAKADRIALLFKQSKPGARFADCRFDNFRARPGAEKAFEIAKRYAESWPPERGGGLLFFGACGNGKSHLAAAVVNYLIPQGIAAVVQPVPELLRMFRATYNEESKIRESELMDGLIEADLLVLDDIGAEKWTEYSESQLYQVIDARYRHMKPLIVTTNLGLTKEPLLEDAIGMRAMDRLIEMCLLVENRATSYRKEIAATRKGAT